MVSVMLDFDHCYDALASRDGRFDGWFFIAVKTTGIYCRPSCPARTPKRENIRFYATAAAAQEAGFRACRRCRPEAAPGSPEWDGRGDVVARAMRLIGDGVVDREGVGGLAARLGYSQRHLHRILVERLGAGPQALARSRRAHAARVLLESSSLTVTEVAFASGFSSLRQFNDTVRRVFHRSPTELRRSLTPSGGDGALTLRLPLRQPFDGDALLRFLERRALPGVEEVRGDVFARSLRLPRGAGTVELTIAADAVTGRFQLDDARDLAAAVERCRRLCDLDSDPVAIDDRLGADGTLGPLVRAHPGRRVPGAVDGAELAMRAVLGQQITVAHAGRLAGVLLATCGEPLATPLGAVTHLFPPPAALVEADPASWPMPAARSRTVQTLARALADGELVLDAGADPLEAQARLRALPGIGPWTNAYIAMRALRDPDAFPAADAGIRRALEGLGLDGRPLHAERAAEAWRPFRAYAVQHLWGSLASARPEHERALAAVAA
jgi:AraC family transcriptional regulator, regulatory protein of adaptative response / DNA-3-methyladenine glycosylase II